MDRIPVPVPPTAEQLEIVQRVDKLLALVAKIERRASAANSKVEQITQSILAKAFRGELVTTEAELARLEGRDYESASVLLGRIRAERAANGDKPGRKASVGARAARRPKKAENPASSISEEPPPGLNGSVENSQREQVELESDHGTRSAELRVITVKQPHADNILFGSKCCENRNWSTNYRGPLYIHAAGVWAGDSDGTSLGAGQTSAILGRVELVDVVDLRDGDQGALRRVAQRHGLPTDPAAMQHVGTEFAWVVARRAVLAKPIRTKGKLKIWRKRVRAARLQFLPTIDFDGQTWTPTADASVADTDRPSPASRPPTAGINDLSARPQRERPAVAAADDDSHVALRPIESTERDEVLAVIREVFSAGGARTRLQAIKEISAALGYARTGSRIAQALSADLRAAVRRGILENNGDSLRLLCRSITDYTREFLVEQLTAGMGATWWGREELIEGTARWLGFRRTGPVIRDNLKSAINGAIRRGLLTAERDRIRRAR